MAHRHVKRPLGAIEMFQEESIEDSNLVHYAPVTRVGRRACLNRLEACCRRPKATNVMYSACTDCVSFVRRFGCCQIFREQ